MLENSRLIFFLLWVFDHKDLSALAGGQIGLKKIPQTLIEGIATV